jgi:hypothetical protein
MRPYHRERALQISELYHKVVTYALNTRKVGAIHLLSSERAALGKSGLTTGRLAQNGCATLADNDGLGVGEDGSDGEATRALDVHEERAGSGDKGLSIEKYQQPCRDHQEQEIRTLSLCFLASAAGLGLRRSTART